MYVVVFVTFRESVSLLRVYFVHAKLIRGFIACDVTWPITKHRNWSTDVKRRPFLRKSMVCVCVCMCVLEGRLLYLVQFQDEVPYLVI